MTKAIRELNIVVFKIKRVVKYASEHKMIHPSAPGNRDEKKVPKQKYKIALITGCRISFICTPAMDESMMRSYKISII